MSIPSKQDIIRLKTGRARRALAEASNLIEHNFYHAAVSRLYYACFYATSALLCQKDIFVKSHSGVRQMLGMHYISTSQMSLASGQFYSELFNFRQHADYDDFADPDPELVKEFLTKATEFVSEAQHILEL